MSATPDYDALAAWAESDEAIGPLGPNAVVHRGETARAASRALLEDAAETDDEREAVERAKGGRPRLDPTVKPGKNSPMWNIRVPETLDGAARARAAAEGKHLSTLIRDAVQAYLAAS